MLPRIGIPWYRVAIKKSVFEDNAPPRGFNFDIDIPIIPTIPEFSLNPMPSMAYEPSMAYAPSMVTVPNPLLSPVPGLVPGTVPVPGLVPLPSPVNVPVPIPNPVTTPGTVPLPKPINIPIPKPIGSPTHEKEHTKQPSLQPIPTYAEMMEMQKQATRQIINNKAYKEMLQIDMLMERDLAQRRRIDKNAKLNVFEKYQEYITKQNNTLMPGAMASPEVIKNQVKTFNETMRKIELKVGDGKDIIFDYIKTNEITFATLPYHYKEINKQIAKAGLTGLAVGTIAYLLYQIAKVSLVLI